MEPGDILLVRAGYDGRRLAEGPVHPLQAGTPALHAACCPWLRERGVAMGLWLIDNVNLEDLARTVARLNRWEFGSSAPSASRA